MRQPDLFYDKSHQEDLLEPLENLPHHLPHLGNQLEDPERTQAAQHHQQLSPRLGRDVGGQPAQEDQAHLHKPPRAQLSSEETCLLLPSSCIRPDFLEEVSFCVISRGGTVVSTVASR